MVTPIVWNVLHELSLVNLALSVILKATDPKLLVIRYQEELPTLISSRADKHVTLSELVKLMEWKLTVSSI